MTSSDVVEHKRYVCSDALKNNNKVWEYMVHSDQRVTVKYGRVGGTLAVDGPKTMSRKDLDKKIAAKTGGRGKLGTAGYKPPYREITVIAGATGPTGPKLSTEELKAAATAQLAKADPVVTKLVERLVEVNRHELHKASGGQLNVDLATGIVMTPVGVVTKDNVKEARVILDKLAPYVLKSNFNDSKFIVGLNDYLMLVPQKVGHSRGWHEYFMSGQQDLTKQSTLLDQLEASAELADARMKAAAAAGTAPTALTSVPNLFNAELEILTDPVIIKKITDMFMSNINRSHEAARLRPVKFYRFHLPHSKEAWDKDGAKLDNHMLLWHGTRVFNLLSIMKSGLLMPRTLSTMQIAGAMFGNGLYFSDQSTKSLNYSYGYWDGRARDTNCFMFLADVAMGKSYTPKGSYETLPKAGYDSTFADQRSGVRNKEMIVYRLGQANLRYLVEFDEK
jgi:poly [ADP-ribose] polymerase